MLYQISLLWMMECLPVFICAYFQTIATKLISDYLQNILPAGIGKHPVGFENFRLILVVLCHREHLVEAENVIALAVVRDHEEGGPADAP